MELICSKKLELNVELDCKTKELYLEYYLIACESENFCTYGIQISMAKDNGESETAVIHDILSSKENMIELIKLLYSNSVTPVSAYDVICDCIS
ncbi:MAG TPA: DUF6514 family protein [Ruminiclostridium sp.]